MASILAQPGVPLEVLVVDDASRDRTGEVARRWAGRDSRVRVLKGAGQGIVPALELARKEACGEYLARMDADDVALPGRIAAQLRLLESDPRVGLCGTGVRYVPEEHVRDGARRYQRWLNGLTTHEALVRDRFVECPLAHPTWMIRSTAAEEVGGYRDQGWPEDYDLLLRLVEAGWELGAVSRVGLLWRDHPDRLSRLHGRYTPDAFLHCRVHYLRRAFPHRPAALICSAGPTGKAFSRAWTAAGGEVRAFVDVDPRKVGQEIHDVPVLTQEEARPEPGLLAVMAVGQEGGRQELRSRLAAHGFVEGVDSVAVA